MSRRSSAVEARSLLLVASSALCAGCLSLAPGAGDIGRPDAAVQPALTEVDTGAGGPAVVAEVDRALPSLYQTIYANGVAWLGYNVATAEGGTLRDYDTGDGMAFGLAFGNGEDVKRFFEIGYEKTGGHRMWDDQGNMLSKASHERFYVGIRRYLLPPAAEGSGRVSPFLVGGVTVQNIRGDSAIPTSRGYVEDANGVGIYMGTGLEIYIGSSSQWAVALDVRATILSYDGYPEGTGTQSSVGSAVFLAYHF
ncbi:MAG: hypothetical protein ACYSU0_01880 [Planctomycetota bacterium]|jgi:hypothetical protein